MYICYYKYTIHVYRCSKCHHLRERSTPGRHSMSTAARDESGGCAVEW